nr:hypothetical protein BaRGS_025683 [Batillaria attramentaria]
MLLLLASFLDQSVGSSGSAPLDLKVSMDFTDKHDDEDDDDDDDNDDDDDDDDNDDDDNDDHNDDDDDNDDDNDDDDKDNNDDNNDDDDDNDDDDADDNDDDVDDTDDDDDDGYILKLESGKKPVNIYRLGSQMGRIRVRDTKEGQRIMVLADTGVVILNQTFGVVYQFAQTCNLTDCLADMGRDGMVGVVRRYEHVLEVYTDGQLTANKSFPTFDYSHHFMDVAIDPGNKRLVLGYFYQSHPHNVPVQVPCVISYDYTLKQVWQDYCVSGDDDYKTQNMADSRCNQLYYSDVDDKLFMGGYNDGGNTIFNYDPASIAKNHYSTKGSSSGDGNSVGTNAVAGGSGGVLVAAQTSGASIENRDNQTINGQKTAGYGGGDGVLLVVSGDFQKRLAWHQFHKTTGHSNGVAVAANSVKGKNRVAFLVESKDAEFLQINQLKGTGHAKGSSLSQTALVLLDI